MNKINMKVNNIYIDPYKDYRVLLRIWENKCVLCGELFDNMESITKEHLIPKSKGGFGFDNFAPSHFNCNQLRGELSLTEIMILLQARKVRYGKESFRNWCNRSVPNRRLQTIGKYV